MYQTIVKQPDDEPYRFWKMYPDTYVIHYGEALDIFLLLGKEKALLIDTAYGRGDFPNIVERCREGRELIVANTHGHFDHTGGNRFFPKVYMHRNAFSYANHSFEKLDEKWLANMPYPDYEMAELKDGDIIDLGDRKVEVLWTPAHSDSSLTYLDHKRRLLFCGDEFDSGQANLSTGKSVEAFLKNCRRLKERENEYDFIMPNHNGCPIAREYLDDFITAAEHIVDGNPDLVSQENLENYMYSIYPGAVRVQVGNSCINYRPGDGMD